MDQAIIDGRELAAALKTHPASIRQHRAGLRSAAVLAGLPDPIQTKPKLLWLKADIEAWLESRRTFRPAVTTTAAPPAPAEAERKRGRPRNAARQGQAAATAKGGE